MVLLTTKPDSLHFLVPHSSVISLLLKISIVFPPPQHFYCSPPCKNKVRRSIIHNPSLFRSKRTTCLQCETAGMYIINAINKCSTTHTKDFCPFKYYVYWHQIDLYGLFPPEKCFVHVKRTQCGKLKTGSEQIDVAPIQVHMAL